ncbi:class I SAM-dependent methyltransferase [Aeromonas veronii]|uniref:class I SAM-dependent methyltransferase n=1 Tax=Aeromonas veronii TaxID=654 RepID=UPI003BA05BAC
MINPKKVKKFWESRAELYSVVALESVANLEQDPTNLQIKIDDETAKVFSWLPSVENKNILDLGAGVGQWSFRFAERNAKRVLAVEYTEGLAKIGEKEARARKMDQVEFVVCAAEEYKSTEKFDLIFISGLFVYLNDDQAKGLLANLDDFLTDDGLLMLRDGTGVAMRYEIDDNYSEHLAQNYSATYRTANEYITLFENAGFSCIQSENMFPESHPLNKYKETRLRLFLFRKS